MSGATARRDFEIAIERLSHEGRGVGRLDGKSVFVAAALPGERVRARLTRRHGRYDEAVAEEVLEASPERVQPACPHAGRCGGCSLQHLAPAAQIAHKQAMLEEQLRHQGVPAARRLLPPLEGARLGYRRRARLSVRHVPKKGGVLVGFREHGSHFVADIDRCEVLVPAVGRQLPALRDLIGSLSVAARVPQVEVAADDGTAVLVIRHLAPLTAADRQRLAGFERETGLVICLQPGGPETVTGLAGEAPTLAYAIGSSRLAFRPGDFVQVHAELNRRLVPLAVELLDAGPGDRVLELFCGLGNFSLELARRAASVTGVEQDAGLLERAAANARANGRENCEFVAADLFTEAGLARIPDAGHTRLLLDPPRSGAALALRTLALGPIGRVVYVSCNPATLARDAAILTRERGMRLAAAGVIDMFPHTAHVESIALFDRP